MRRVSNDQTLPIDTDKTTCFGSRKVFFGCGLLGVFCWLVSLPPPPPLNLISFFFSSFLFFWALPPRDDRRDGVVSGGVGWGVLGRPGGTKAKRCL